MRDRSHAATALRYLGNPALSDDPCARGVAELEDMARSVVTMPDRLLLDLEYLWSVLKSRPMVGDAYALSDLMWLLLGQSDPQNATDLGKAMWTELSWQMIDLASSAGEPCQHVGQW